VVEPNHHEVVAVLSSSAEPGLRAARALSHAFKRSGRAAAQQFRIGVGLDVDRIADLPQSYKEAVTAISALDGTDIVRHLASINLDRYLRYSANKTARRLTPSWSAKLAEGKFGKTLEAFARASLNVKTCARLLDVHTNTVYHRLNAIKRKTGVDPRTYAGLSNLLAIISLSESSGRDASLRA
jgi:carbohydrate diacid regulator